MAKRRVAVLAAGAAALIAVALVAMGDLPLTAIYIVYQSFFPSTISWDGKLAYAKCDAAIADPASWPKATVKACEAMHMCANEAQLSPAQLRTLAEAVQRTPGCEAL
jgi:hypothetical protein